MPQTHEILIGLDAGAESIEAVAFDRDGRELQTVAIASPVARLEQGPEQDLGDLWQAAARALRQLASQVPDLGPRTAALAITARSGGAWLIDEDGDPVAPAWPGPARRAQSLVERWRQTGIARELQAITGVAPDTASANVQMAWLLRHRPEILERAASALGCKDWLYFCCTGERATDAADGVASFGSRRTRAYDPAVLRLLNLEEVERLLPEIIDGTRHQGALSRAAAAATGLRSGTPVVLAPPDLVAKALAAGLAEPGQELAVSILGTTTRHLRVLSDRHESNGAHGSKGANGGHGANGADGAAISRLPYVVPRTALAICSSPGTADADWLVDLGVQLSADAGLIGIRRDELRTILERKAAQARAGALLLQPFGSDHGLPEASPVAARAHVLGIDREATVYDLMRALHEGQGFAARASHVALGGPPAELRLIDEAASSPLGRTILAACVGARVRVVERTAPGAAGAALFAAVALGQYKTVAEAGADWVRPWLGEAEPVDPDLQARYAQLYPIHCGARPVTAGIAQALDQIGALTGAPGLDPRASPAAVRWAQPPGARRPSRRAAIEPRPDRGAQRARVALERQIEQPRDREGRQALEQHDRERRRAHLPDRQRHAEAPLEHGPDHEDHGRVVR